MFGLVMIYNVCVSASVSSELAAWAALAAAGWWLLAAAYAEKDKEEIKMSL